MADDLSFLLKIEGIDHGEQDRRRDGPPISSEKHDTIKAQEKELKHLEDVVYKPLSEHFKRALLMIETDFDKKAQLVKKQFDFFTDALHKRKMKIIKNLEQKAKTNKAIIEIKKKAMEKEWEQLRECRRRQQDIVRDKRNGKSSDIMINFMHEVNYIQRKARKISTENSIMELDDLEIVTDSEVEGSIKNAVKKLATLRETAKLLKSRVGTPTSSSSWSLEDSTQSSSSSSEDGKQQFSQPQRGNPTSLRVPVQPQRTQSLSPNPPGFTRVPVTPRDVRSEADGCVIQGPVS